MKPAHIQVKLTALGLLTLFVVSMGFVSLREQQKYRLPDDGVFWMDSGRGVMAREVDSSAGAESAGLRPGDVLLDIDGHTVATASDVSREIFSVGIGGHAHYRILRGGTPAEFEVVLQPQERHQAAHSYLQLVGLLYLAMGLFVLFRRFAAPHAAHFYLFCLASFALFVFSYTGKLNPFDWTVYWMNAAAMLLQPALFAHFCVAYPGAQGGSARVGSRGLGKQVLLFVIYGGAAALAAAHLAVFFGILRFKGSLVEVRWLLDRLEIGYLSSMFLLGIGMLTLAYRKTHSLFLRKQIGWVLGGSILAVLPFTSIYALPYFLGIVPGPWMNLSILSLIILPVAFSYAIVRYRLLDVDIMLQRGVAYTLATGILAGAYVGLAALAGDLFRTKFPAGGTVGLILAVVATGLLFQPLQRWIHQKLEGHFLPKRYDYRDALLALGRKLGTETDLDRMMRSLLEQLVETLKLKQAAVFLAEDADMFAMRHSIGVDAKCLTQPDADFGFLRMVSAPDSTVTRNRLFIPSAGVQQEILIERELGAFAAQQPAWPLTVARIGMPYYFACRAGNRVLAVIGIGRTVDGELLWEEDAALVESLAGYLAVAIENVKLLQTLGIKAGEYERLQEFSENILESINVGLLAVDLEDRVEAANSPLKTISPIRIAGGLRNPADDLRGKKLSEILPPDLAEQLDRLRDDGGIHNIYRYRMNNGNGEERVLNIAVAPLLSKNCDWIGRLIIFDDVTDRVDLETQLAQAEKLSSVGLLAAGVAHEVNTPLTVISTQAQMLAKQLPPGDKSFKTVEKIIGQTFRASEIVNSLLNFSRTKGSSFTTLDVNKIISETLLLLDHQFKTARIQVESDLDPSLPAISGNSDKLQQVFLNMFLNAKDAMPEGGRLRVASWAENSHLEIEIGDTGIGIAPENLHRIYDPFFTTKGSGRGTGLGLAVSYGIIHEHAGQIRVESLPGLGTKFRLQFPTSKKEVHA